MEFTAALTVLKSLYAGVQTYEAYAPVIANGVQSVAAAFPNLATEASALKSGFEKIIADGEAVVQGKGSIGTVASDGSALLASGLALYNGVKGGAAVVSSVVANASKLPQPSALQTAFTDIEGIFGIK